MFVKLMMVKDIDSDKYTDVVKVVTSVDTTDEVAELSNLISSIN